MKCPICEGDFDENSVEGCICGYSKDLMERLGSILEYYGQLMTSHASLILVIVIGLFSVIGLNKPYLPHITIYGVRINISALMYAVFAILGLYEIWRLIVYASYNMALANMIQSPYALFIREWKRFVKEEKREGEEYPDFIERICLPRFIETESEKRKIAPSKWIYWLHWQIRDFDLFTSSTLSS